MPSPKAEAASRRAPSRASARPSGPVDDPHAPPAAAGRRLDQHAASPAPSTARRVGEGAVGVHHDGGEGGHPGRPHQLLGRHLGAHGVDGVGGRADPDQAGPGHRPGGVARLGEEAVAGVDGVGPGAGGRLEEQVGAEVGVGRGGARQPDGQVGLPDVGAVGVGVGVDGHAGDAHGPGGADDAPGDLAAVGDQQRADGAGAGPALGRRGSRPPTSGTRRSRGCPRWVGCR